MRKIKWEKLKGIKNEIKYSGKVKWQKQNGKRLKSTNIKILMNKGERK